jgi:AmmeMemoRadiSam system protein B/AmmeMemoRadiSam system protein A
MGSVRAAAVAGMFYPGDAGTLGAQVEALLAGAGEPAPRLGFPKALVVPHAGYVYSGSIAARAYDELGAARGCVRRVVLLGPAHRVAVRGLALPTAEAFATPLGRVPVDAQALRALHDLPQVVRSDAAHALEHSLEVQLPFLQKQLGEFSLAPLAVGMASAQQVQEVLERLWGGRETLIVISTDLSHYHPYEEARRIDAATLARIAACATDIHPEEACGAVPLNGLLSVARKRGLPVELLAACNSGDSAGGKGQVVGYASFALFEGPQATAAQAGDALLGIARGAIEQQLFQKSAAACDAPWLAQPGASFVTLKKGDELRGCVGSLQASRALAQDVAQNALGAAFCDPRFPALAAGEWPQCRVEVCLLSPPKALSFVDEADLLAQIRPGEDGLVLEAQGRRGTFLPQVWESLPDARAFLRELAKKTGLAPGTPLARCRILRYRVVKFDGR